MDTIKKIVRVIAKGGTGETTSLGLMHMQESMTMTCCANGSDLPMPFSINYESMDTGSEFLPRLKEAAELGESEDQPAFARSRTTFDSDRMTWEGDTDSYQSAGNDSGSSEIRYRDILDDWQQEGTLLTQEKLDSRVSKGLYGNMDLASTVCSLFYRKARETKADLRSGWKAISDELNRSDEGTYIYAVFVLGLNGGEGHHAFMRDPQVLRRYCMESYMKFSGCSEEEAGKYIFKHLKIGVIAFGSCFIFPSDEKHPKNFANRTREALRNLPKETEEAIDAFYLIEHDLAPVQAEYISAGGPQGKHSYIGDLIAYHALRHFIGTDPDKFSHSMFLPVFSFPGNGTFNWENLGLPEEYRRALCARIRFDAALIHWLYPFLGTDDHIWEADILHRMYGTGNKIKKLKRAADYETLEKTVLRPYRNLLRQEMDFLGWLFDISQTGRDWNRDPEKIAADTADYFPVFKIRDLLNKVPVSELGGMTAVRLDDYTAARSDNRFYTELTLKDVRDLVTYRKDNKPREFGEILKDIYIASYGRKGKNNAYT